jgi:hypothetical protein
MTADELIALERQGWEALSSGGEVAQAFYDGILDADVLMLFPGGMVLDDRATIVGSMAGPPWSRHELEDVRVLALTPDAGVVAYSVVAERDGSEYSALISSTYVRRDDGWKLAFHQQTPRQ